jgi:asparagine synthase (glutamine-hydrolysing)
MSVNFEMMHARKPNAPAVVLLSGGLDSSSIVMMIDALKVEKLEQNTFSARFKDFERDEGKYIDEVIRSCKNINAHFTWPDQDYFNEVFDQVTFHQDEPFSSASIVAQFAVMALAKKSNVTVLLDGQGADEQLAGYLPYYSLYLDELKFAGEPLFNRELLAYQKFHAFPYTSSFANETLRMKLGRVRNKIFGKEQGINYDLRKQLANDTCITGLKELLRYADRNAMAHSREVRLPFLSHKLVEFVFSLPTEYLLHMGWTKYVLRRSMETILPSTICWRTDKIGYEPPQNRWLDLPGFKREIERCSSALGINYNREISGEIDWRLLMASKFI